MPFTDAVWCEKVMLSISKEFPSVSSCCSADVKLDWGCGCCCANNVWVEMEPLPNMDIIGEITRTIANITQRIGCSILLTLLLNNNYQEAGIFKHARM